MTSQTHLSYEVSKKLKEFLGESAPEPLDLWEKPCLGCPGKDRTKCGRRACGSFTHWRKAHLTERYKLHDLLSRPFCEAMCVKLKKWHPDGISEMLWGCYYAGGIPGVEKRLFEMMEAK